VKRLVSPIENSYKNVTTDNWYTNIPLLHYLLEKKTTLLGTMKKNKREIPPEFLLKKPEIILDYNTTNGGVDTCDDVCFVFRLACHKAMASCCVLYPYEHCRHQFLGDIHHQHTI